MTHVFAVQVRSIKSVMESNTIKNGKYRHFKGKEYEVLGIARHSETLEELVVYRQLYGDSGLWLRPLSMFIERVEFNGKRVNRFEYIGV